MEISTASLGQGRGETGKSGGKNGKSKGEPRTSSLQGGTSGTRGLHVCLGNIGKKNGSAGEHWQCGLLGYSPQNGQCEIPSSKIP